MKINHKLKSKNYPKSKHSRAFFEVLFITLAAIGVVYLAALITYSPSENPWSGGADIDKKVINQAGIFGAYLGDISLSILGWAAYIIPISLIWLGFGIHKNIDQPPIGRIIISIRIFAFFALIIFSAAFLAQNTATPAGGWVGIMLHNYFAVLFGQAAFVVYLSIIMIGFALSSNLSWVKLFGILGRFLSIVFSKIFNIIRNFKIPKRTKTSLAPSTNFTIKPRPKPKSKPKTEPISANLFSAKEPAKLPDLTLLNQPKNNKDGYSKQDLSNISEQVELKLKDFGFEVKVIAVTPGPVVTQFELSLAPGVKVSRVINLSKDLARALLVESVRIVDVIPGKPLIGLEIPNIERQLISIKEVIDSDQYKQSELPLTVALGKDINGIPVIANLAKMPHLLLAGATGMGKSVGLNAIILSILYKSSPKQVRLILIDPKIVELACYADIPHLLTPVITDMNQAASALWWCVNEMERRYALLAKFQVRNIDGFNHKIAQAKAQDAPLLDPFFNEKTAAEGEVAAELEELPLIVLVIDEYADMLGSLAQDDRTKSKRVESLIVRLAQKARAAGIHLIITTQRPSVDVITGLIKSNVPSRIAFKVSSKVDSRTILDIGGAEQLLGMGDMLYMTPGLSHLTRVHGAFVDDDEINRVVEFLRETSEPNYLTIVTSTENNDDNEQNDSKKPESSGEEDPLYDEAVQIVTDTRRASISSLQRRLRIGYNRAARIIDDMEISGVVGPMNNAGNREILAPPPLNND